MILVNWILRKMPKFQIYKLYTLLINACVFVFKNLTLLRVSNNKEFSLLFSPINFSFDRVVNVIKSISDFIFLVFFFVITDLTVIRNVDRLVQFFV